jgi:hypothetical protein
MGRKKKDVDAAFFADFDDDGFDNAGETEKSEVVAPGT